MAGKIQQALGVAPELVPGGGGIFDVAVDGAVEFSKFKVGSFPDEDKFVKELASKYKT